jgi:hypothetical protein
LLQVRFTEVARPANPGPAPRLLLTARRLPEPFRVYPDRGVVVSTWDSAGVCRYTGLTIDNYLLIAGLLALSQWRVLWRNRLLQLDDLHHPKGVRCVFAGPHSVQEFALLLDPPAICPGCVNFYHCLGADSELIALRNVLAEVTPSAPAKRFIPVPL